MARRRFAPQHDITGPAIFVPEDDDAWDRERIGREMAALRDEEIAHCKEEQGEDYEVPKWAERGDKPPDIAHPKDPAHNHPFVRYQRGLTRYDLRAEGISDYLDENAKPEKWILKHLSYHARSQVQRFQTERRHGDALALAFLEGVRGVENGDKRLAKLLKRREDDKTVDDDEIIDAAANLSYSAIEQAGFAVMQLSRDLTEEEKKA